MTATLTLGVDRGGRPHDSDDRLTRLKHIRCAYHRTIGGWSFRRLARKYRVTTRTIRNWTAAAPDYPDVEAGALCWALADVEKFPI